jgi:LytS/YehU family sensor histidine kinase
MADRLVITIADTGPGLNAATNAANCDPVTGGTQVGLANIRDRLAQAYGDDHRFELAENSPQGLIVLIDIPYQIENVAATVGGDGRGDTRSGAPTPGPQSIAAQ